MSTLGLRLTGMLVAVIVLLVGSAPFAAALDDGGAIDAAYQRLGGSAGRLGQPLDGGWCGLKDNGCVRHYQGGSIHWSPSSGAHATWGGIETSWARLGWENGRLGYPLEEERCGRAGGGCVQDFQGGLLYWTPSYGAVPVWGAIRATWGSIGWEAGRLGYPTEGERCARAGNGCVQDFSNGTVYWSPGYGAHPVFAAFLSRWGSLGWEWGRLGYPTSDERCNLRASGCLQEFTGGKLYWSPSTSANPMWGAIGSYWATYGWENGPFGYPTSGESCSAACTQDFWGGRITWKVDAPTSYMLWDWNPLVAVNKRLPLSPPSYVPPSLVGVGTQQMRADAADSLRRMISDASASGVSITTVSGYRSYDQQASLYNSYLAQYGQAYADTVSARPGYSEHQTGLAMDIGNPDGGCGLQVCFANTPAGLFAANNAWKYGFIVRYPDGLQNVTGYTYEPWHLRYVGPDAAGQMRSWGMSTLEQYFTTASAPSY
jgi:D-alanyl-D-alanine carboxypeptidase